MHVAPIVDDATCELMTHLLDASRVGREARGVDDVPEILGVFAVRTLETRSGAMRCLR